MLKGCPAMYFKDYFPETVNLFDPCIIKTLTEEKVPQLYEMSVINEEDF